MINAIIKYAEQNDLGMDDDSSNFESRAVPWDISLTLNGTLGPDPNHSDGEPKIKIINGKTKQIKTKRELSVPFTSKTEVAGGKVYHTLYGTLDILLGKSDKESAADKLEFFKNRCLELAKQCPQNSARLKSIVKFLENKNEVKKAVKFFDDNKVKLTELATFVVNNTCLVKETEVRQAWKNIRKIKTDSTESNKHICLITGEYTEIIKRVESVKRIHGGLGSGVSLISFDKPSFCSFGRDGCDNAPISIESELKLRYGLQSLIDNNSVVMGGNTYLYWMKKNIETNDIMKLLKTGGVDEVKKMLISPVSGNTIDSVVVDNNVYYLISVIPNGGRMAIKNYITCGLNEITTNVRKWFMDLEYVGCNRYGIESFIWSLKKPGEKYDDYNHYNNMIDEMVQSALLNRPLPSYLLSEAVHRETINKITNEGFNPSRLSLMKLYLNRKGNHMKEKFNEQSIDVAYLCGCLLAVINRLQKQAMPHVLTPFTERMFGSACSRPQYAFSLILPKIQGGYYYKQANRICPGMGVNRQKEINQLVDTIGKQGGFPSSLSIEERAKFCIGYSQQINDYTERKNVEKQ